MHTPVRQTFLNKTQLGSYGRKRSDGITDLEEKNNSLVENAAEASGVLRVFRAGTGEISRRSFIRAFTMRFMKFFGFSIPRVIRVNRATAFGGFINGRTDRSTIHAQRAKPSAEDPRTRRRRVSFEFRATSNADYLG